MPDIETIYQEYRDQGVLVFGLYSDESQEQIQDFEEQSGVTFPLIQSATLNRFVWPNGVGYPYPRDVVIGKDLTVRSIKNSFNVDEMDALVQQLLAE